MTKPTPPVTPARPQPAPARVGAVAPAAPVRAAAPVQPVPVAPVQAAVVSPTPAAVPQVPVTAPAVPVSAAPVPNIATLSPVVATASVPSQPAAVPVTPTPAVVKPVEASHPEPATPPLERPVEPSASAQPSPPPAGVSAEADPWASSTPDQTSTPSEPALRDLIPDAVESGTTPDPRVDANVAKTPSPRFGFKKKTASGPSTSTKPERPSPAIGSTRAATALKTARLRLPSFGRVKRPLGNTVPPADDAVPAPLVQTKRPLPRAALLGLTAALLIGGALLARQLLTPASTDLGTTPLEQLTPASPTVSAGEPTGQTTPTLPGDSAASRPSSQPSDARSNQGSDPRSAQATTASPQASANTPATPTKPVQVKPRPATTPTTNLMASNTNPVAGRIVRPDPLLARTFGSARTANAASVSTTVQGAAARSFQGTTPTNAVEGQQTGTPQQTASVARVSAVAATYGSPPPAAPIPVSRVPQAQPVPAPVPVSTPSLLPPVTALPAVKAQVPPLPSRPTTIRLPDPTPLPPITLSRPTTPSTPPFVTPSSPTTPPSSPVSITPPTTVAPSASTPSVTSIPVSPTEGIRYLGYVSGESPIAIIDVQGRSETVSEGQPIPGTTLTVHRVTPSALKVSTPDEAPTSLPLEVTP